MIGGDSVLSAIYVPKMKANRLVTSNSAENSPRNTMMSANDE